MILQDEAAAMAYDMKVYAMDVDRVIPLFDVSQRMRPTQFFALTKSTLTGLLWWCK